MPMFGGAEYDVTSWHVSTSAFIFTRSVSVRHSSRRSHEQLIAIRLSEIAKGKYITYINASIQIGCLLVEKPVA